MYIEPSLYVLGVGAAPAPAPAQNIQTAIVSTPAAVCDCFGLVSFRNLVAWTLINKRVRNCFNGTWYIGTILS